MRVILTIAIVLGCTFGQAATANQRGTTDATIDAMIAASFYDEIRLSVALYFSEPYHAALKERSVSILDRDRFALLLSLKEADEFVLDTKQLVEDMCLSRFKDQLYDAVLGAETGADSVQFTPDEIITFAVENAEVCAKMILSETDRKIRQKVLNVPSIDLTNLNEILNTQGVLSFPNRVVRAKLVADVKTDSR